MRLFYLILLLLLLSGKQQAQMFGVFTPTIVKNGTYAQHVRIITKAVFSDIGHTLGQSFFIDYSTNTIRVSSCYNPASVFPMVTTVIDTVNIGILYQGNYTLDYAAYYSLSATECVPYDTAYAIIFPFYVGPSALKEESSFRSIRISPNPVKDKFIIRGSEDPETLSVYNAIGQKVLVENAPEVNTEISVEALTPGIYFMRLESGTLSRTIKFIKE